MNEVYWGNTVMAYLVAAGGILLAWIVISVLKKYVLKKIRSWTSRTDNHFDDILFSVVEKFVLPYIYIFINYNIITQLNLHSRLRRAIEIVFLLLTIFYVVRLINHVLQLSINGIMKRRHESEERIRQLNGVLNIIKAFTWLIGFIFLLDNLGYDVTTIIAGLGVGGIAIALAAQTILGDLFSYFTIFFDRPFEIGDFVVVGPVSGSIEHIGLKTTRVRSLSGEQLVMSNSELTRSTIHNYKRLQQRRVVFKVGVIYQTKKEHVGEIPAWLKEIVLSKEEVRFDRSHLQAFGDFSINFEVVYFILSSDYNKFMDTHQSILLDIHALFESKGIEFAYPTQTIMIENAAGIKSKDELFVPSQS
jgi:small-conductance mechanosensitive channel